MANQTSTKSQIPWHVTRRMLEFRGEERANLLRLVGITSFYVLHLVNAFALEVKGIDETFHNAMTAIACIWAMLAAVVVLSLRNRLMPAALKHATTVMDVALLTGVLTIADGARSPMAVVYLLIIMLAGLRANPRVVWTATAASLVGYAAVIGQALLYRPDMVPPTHHGLTMGLAILLSGVVLSQIANVFQTAIQAHADVSQRVEKLNKGEAP